MRFCVSHHSVYFCKVLLPLQENISQNNPKGLKQNFSQLYPCLTTKFFLSVLQKNTQILDRGGRQCCNSYHSCLQLLKSVLTTAQVKHVVFVLLDKKLLIFFWSGHCPIKMWRLPGFAHAFHLLVSYIHISRFANAKCVVKQ